MPGAWLTVTLMSGPVENVSFPITIVEAVVLPVQTVQV